MSKAILGIPYKKKDKKAKVFNINLGKKKALVIKES